MQFNNTIPIYVQVINDIKHEIITGNLKLGEKLPSGRDLALKYQINPNTANRIYKELEAEQLCFTKRGLGTFVTENEETVYMIKNEMAENLLNEFIDGMKKLGFTNEEIIKIIKEKYSQEGRDKQ